MEVFEIERVLRPKPKIKEILPGSTPVISFGNPHKSTVATLGINPSTKEFLIGNKNKRLRPIGSKRLIDLEILKKQENEPLSIKDAEIIIQSCYEYFENKNWYKSWFKPMEQMVLSQLGFSYFAGNSPKACHLDIVQWATDPVWSLVSKRSKELLVESDREFLAKQLKVHKFKFILLNGDSAIAGANQTGVVNCETIFQGSFSNLVKNYRIVTGIGLGDTRFYGWSCNLQALRGSTEDKFQLMSSIIDKIKRESSFA